MGRSAEGGQGQVEDRHKYQDAAFMLQEGGVSSLSLETLEQCSHFDISQTLPAAQIFVW